MFQQLFFLTNSNLYLFCNVCSGLQFGAQIANS